MCVCMCVLKYILRHHYKAKGLTLSFFLFVCFFNAPVVWVGLSADSLRVCRALPRIRRPLAHLCRVCITIPRCRATAPRIPFPQFSSLCSGLKKVYREREREREKKTKTAPILSLLYAHVDGGGYTATSSLYRFFFLVFACACRHSAG